MTFWVAKFWWCRTIYNFVKTRKMFDPTSNTCTTPRTGNSAILMTSQWDFFENIRKYIWYWYQSKEDNILSKIKLYIVRFWKIFKKLWPFENLKIADSAKFKIAITWVLLVYIIQNLANMFNLMMMNDEERFSVAVLWIVGNLN